MKSKLDCRWLTLFSLGLLWLYNVLSIAVAIKAAEVAESVRARRPNILFIIADDASRNSFGAYGSTYVKTPNFDRIASEGVLFKQAYNCNPKCAPSRACLVTGRYSWQLEEACNHNPFLSDRWSFYPFLMEEAGYFIGYTGKGWGPGIYKNTDAGKGKFSQLNPAGRPFQKRRMKVPFKGINGIDYAGNFEDFLAQVPDDKPFCFWLGAKEPHRGYELDSWKKDGRDLSQVTVPKFFPDNDTVRGDLADYAIEVEWVDKHIGRSLDYLKQRGLLQDTLIIATSDHGMPFPRIKGQIYNEGFHVPFAVRWGAKIKAGRVVSDFITFPDLAPTLLEVAGLPLHSPMTGNSFMIQLLDPSSGRIDETRDHTLLGKERHDIGRTDGSLLSVGYPSRAIRTDDWLYIRNFKPHRWPGGDPTYGLLNCDGSPTKKYLTNLSQNDPEFRFYNLAFGKRAGEELYDMRDDPDCVNNLADDPKFATRRQELWKRLETELIEQQDPRVLGMGDIFDYYPNCRIDRQQKLYKAPQFNPVKTFELKYGKESEFPDRKTDTDRKFNF
ncbi:MAG TPA: heparan N-sulfatase [Verrucomicrobiales bacterium]|nr:heparan N-sulfatase [Verrucomicrobiales bacterium]